MTAQSEQGHAPYIFIVYVKQEEIPETVEVYNWEQRTEWGVSETVHFRDDMPEDLYEQSDLIIDVLNGNIKKNLLRNVSDQDLRQRYFKLYEKQIVEAVKNFFQKHPDAWKSLVETARKVEEELEREADINKTAKV